MIAPGAKQIVVLGGGFGGAYCAQGLRRRLRGGNHQVLLLDRHNYFIFYPLLVEAGTGTLQPRHAVVSIRSFLGRGAGSGGAGFRMADVLSVDTARCTVRYRVVGDVYEQTIGYDHLVLALGSVTRKPVEIPGLSELAFEVKALTDAVALRDRCIQLLELADATADEGRRRALLSMVVVGGSFTGAEVAGEFLHYLRDAARAGYPGVDPGEIGMTLVEHQDRILPALSRGLSDYAAEYLRQRGVRLLLRTSVKEVGPESVVLSDGSVVRAHTTIWCAGIAPPPLIKEVGLPTDGKGWLLCQSDGRVVGFENLWGVGDCAVNPDPQGVGYPATAQHAVREGSLVARNIAAALSGKATEPLVYKTRGTLAALGRRRAVAEVFGLRFKGVVAWFLWRTVYLVKMPGIGRKVRVALDWTADWFFRRDYVELGIHHVTRPEGTWCAVPPPVRQSRPPDAPPRRKAG